MRRISIFFTVFLSLAPCIVLAVGPAEYYASADVAFRGRVSSIQDSPDRITRGVTFQVVRTWKGITNDTAVIFFEPSRPANCHTLTFTVGEEYVVYAHGQDVLNLDLNTCGTKLVSEAAADLSYISEIKDPTTLSSKPANYRNLSQSAVKYIDFSSMTPEERIAVSMLTDAGVVQGNPDGSFAPQRRLTRAEFLKIALLAQLGKNFGEQGHNCFPDVSPNDWFARYVCYAKNSNFVQGYPDGTFHPARSVNYAEATKMLVNLFSYPIAPIRGEVWYLPYLRVATDQHLALSENPQPDTLLTRGQMARLTAAFFAEGIVK